jgi:hypothetical protein
VSKIALEGNASGTGTFTFASPNSSTDRTLDLPDASGVIDRLNRAGNVLQVVSASTATRTQTNSSSYVEATDYSASITPSSTSSKILVLINAALGASGSSNALLSVYQGGSRITASETAVNRVASVDYYCCASFFHEPNTTSSITYQVRIAVTVGSGAVINQNAGMLSYITLMEIAG